MSPRFQLNGLLGTELSSGMPVIAVGTILYDCFRKYRSNGAFDQVVFHSSGQQMRPKRYGSFPSRSWSATHAVSVTSISGIVRFQIDRMRKYGIPARTRTFGSSQA